VHLLERKELLPNESAIARLRLDEPVFAMVGDRFILRDSSEQLTLAGGTVLDAEPGAIKFRSGRQRNLLGARALSPNDLSTLVQTQLERDQSASRDSLFRKAPFSEKEIVSMLKVLERDGRIFLGEKIAADAEWWQSLRRAAAGLVESEHVAHPEEPGLEINRLREALQLESGDVFDALLQTLPNDGFVQSGNTIQRASHRPSLPPELRDTGDRIRRALRARAVDPPSRREIAVDAAAQQALRFFCETGELIALGDDVLISADGFARLKRMLVQHLRTGSAATVSELRQVTGTTRRIIVPLLERLDRLGLTIREGDRRKLR
jgi:selenocysteine-specific elongation factor